MGELIVGGLYWSEEYEYIIILDYDKVLDFVEAVYFKSKDVDKFKTMSISNIQDYIKRLHDFPVTIPWSYIDLTPIELYNCGYCGKVRDQLVNNISLPFR